MPSAAGEPALNITQEPSVTESMVTANTGLTKKGQTSIEVTSTRSEQDEHALELANEDCKVSIGFDHRHEECCSSDHAE